MLKKIILFIAIQFACTHFINAQELVPYCKNGVYGYSDLKGKIKIEPQFRRASLFNNGVAIVYMEHEYFLINTSGKKIFTKGYDDIDLLQGNLYVAQKGDSNGIINNKGKVVLPIIYKSIDCDDKIVIVAEDFNATNTLLTLSLKEIMRTKGKVYVDKSRNENIYTIETTEKTDSLETTETSIVNLDGKILVGSVKGRVSIRSMSPFDLYSIEIKENDKERFGIINEKGEAIIPIEFEEVKLMEVKEKLLEKEAQKIFDGNPKEIKKIVSDKNFLSRLEIYAVKNDKVSVYNFLGKEIIKPITGESVEYIERGNDYFYHVQSSVKDTIADTYRHKDFLFTPEGKQMNTIPITKLDDTWKAEELGLIIATQDTLWGIYDGKGNEFIPFKYEFIEVDRNQRIILYNHQEKSFAFKYPNKPNLENETLWYDDNDSDGPYFTLTTTNYVDGNLYGLLDQNCKLLLPANYSQIRVKTDVAELTTKGINKTKIVYCTSGKQFPLPDGTELEASVNGAKNQFILKNQNSLIFQSGNKTSTIISYSDTDYVYMLSPVRKGDGVYFSLFKNDDVAIYKIEKETIIIVSPFGRNSNKMEVEYGVSYVKNDSSYNYINAFGIEAVPFGKWTSVIDMSTYFGRDPLENNMYLAVSPKKTLAIDNNGKVLKDFKNCRSADFGETEWDSEEYSVFFNMENNKSFFMLFDNTSNKFLFDIPFEGYTEAINDTLFLLKDTLGNGYLFVPDQKKLIKLGIKPTSWTEFGEYSETISFIDENNKLFILDNNTAKLIEIQGKTDGGDYFFSTGKVRDSDYFFTPTKEENGQIKKGIVNSKGKIIAQTKYDAIDMPSDYGDLGVFSCRYGEYTDIINQKGEIVSAGNTNYKSVYTENESVLIAEKEIDGKAYIDMFNAYNNYKRVNYSLRTNGTSPDVVMINDKYIISIVKEMHQTLMDNGEAYEEATEFDVYVGEDGTKYFEFDKTFKEN